MYRLNCRSLMCLPGISLSPAIAEERLMPAPKTGHHNRRQAAILIVVTHRTTRHDIAVDYIDMQGIAILAGALKRQNISNTQPLLSCDLTGGIRLQAVFPPCVDDGTVALAIRRPKGRLSTLDEIAEGGIFTNVTPITNAHSPEVQRLIELYRVAC